MSLISSVFSLIVIDVVELECDSTSVSVSESIRLLLSRALSGRTTSESRAKKR